VGTTEEVKTFWVTPTLFVGSEGPALSHLRPSTVKRALHLIRHGEAVLVPDFDTAREILDLLGMGHDVIEDRIHFARTGKILGAPDLPEYPY
jgi:hypothetical protein